MAANGKDQGIHPRVVNGRTAFPKSNTCATPHNPLRGTLRKVVKAYNIRRHDRDMTVDRLTKSATHKNIDWHKAFRAPGSMKP